LHAPVIALLQGSYSMGADEWTAKAPLWEYALRKAALLVRLRARAAHVVKLWPIGVRSKRNLLLTPLYRKTNNGQF
jgi:hypothetical protein